VVSHSQFDLFLYTNNDELLKPILDSSLNPLETSLAKLLGYMWELQYNLMLNKTYY
jgi:hypothetical protein